MGASKDAELLRCEDAAAEAVGRLWELFDEGDLDGLLARQSKAALTEIAEVTNRLVLLLGGRREP